MRIPSQKPIVARVVQRSARSVGDAHAKASPGAGIALRDTGERLREASVYHGEQGFARADAPREALQSIAAVRGYRAELHAYAHESQRVGRLLDLKV